ncbi:hypothetical protein KIPB_015928, partial [Kipferlia bialata]
GSRGGFDSHRVTDRERERDSHTQSVTYPVAAADRYFNSTGGRSLVAAVEDVFRVTVRVESSRLVITGTKSDVASAVEDVGHIMADLTCVGVAVPGWAIG